MVPRGGVDDLLQRMREVIEAQRRWAAAPGRPVMPQLIDLRRWLRTIVESTNTSLRAFETMTLSNAERALRAGSEDPTVAILRVLRLSGIPEATKDRLARGLVRWRWPEKAKPKHEAARHRAVRRGADAIDAPRRRVSVDGRDYFVGEKDKRVARLPPPLRARWFWHFVDATVHGDTWQQHARGRTATGRKSGTTPRPRNKLMPGRGTRKKRTPRRRSSSMTRTSQRKR